MKRLLFLVIGLLVIQTASAANMWTGWKKISTVQIVEHGGFLIKFTTPVNTKCTQASSDGSTLYIYPDQNGMSADGVKAQLSTALAAHATDMFVTVMYNDATAYCFGLYLAVSKSGA